MRAEMTLSDAMCRVHQAQAILSVWLETMTTSDDHAPNMVGSLLTILDGVADAMSTADEELGKVAIELHRSQSEARDAE
ncbi:hypothetical protein [Aeromonas veronii]|uniref:hypothetical protein n=1 Tax=Aeromonas veronii TaxID=654 RepID=UPI001302C7A5|nr:hypothetical protein [Aeromonas veronii]KAE9627739.1 hypothetical protein GO977_21955 [Aeromonas veronii]